MANDEVLRLQVDAAQATAALASVQQEIKTLEAELETLNATTGVTNAELEGTSRRLSEARGKFDELSKSVGETAKAQEESGKETKSISDKYVQLGLKVFGARQVLMSLGAAMKSVAQATGNYSGATKDAIDQVGNLTSSIASLDLEGAAAALGQLAGQTAAWAQGLNEANIQLGNLVDKKAVKEFTDILGAQRALVEGHQQEIAALDLKAKALSREIDLQQKNGQVSVFLKEKLQEYLDAYAKIHEAVPRILQEQAFELNVVSSETEKLGNTATEAHGKAASAAKGHSDSVAKIAEEQAKVIANAEKIIADIDAAAVRANQAEGGKATGAALAGDAEKLKDQIKAIEDSPIITAEQQRNLDELKNALMDNTRAAEEMDSAFTVTADNFLTDSEAAQKYAAELDLLAAAQSDLARLHEQGLATEEELAAARWDNLEALNQMEDAAGDAGGSFTDLGKSVKKVTDGLKDIGKEGKRGTDAAKEGLENLKEGAEEVKPLLGEILSLLQQIKTAAAEVDL